MQNVLFLLIWSAEKVTRMQTSGSLHPSVCRDAKDSSLNRKSTAPLYLKSHHTGPQVLSHRLSLWWIRLLRPSQHCNRFSPETRLMSFTPPGSYSEQEHTAIIPFTSYNLIAYRLNPLRFLPHRFPCSVFLCVPFGVCSPEENGGEKMFALTMTLNVCSWARLKLYFTWNSFKSKEHVESREVMEGERSRGREQERTCEWLH